MKILYLSRKFDRSRGGAEAANYALAEALAPRCDLTLVAHDCRTLVALGLFHAEVLLRFYFRRRGRFDLIFVGDAALSPLGRTLARRLKIPFVVWAHGLDVTYDRFGYQKLIRPALTRAAGVVCVSRSTEARCVARGVPAEKLKVMYHGISVADSGPHDRAELRRAIADEFDLGASSKILLFLGRLVPRKGVAEFISQVLPRLSAARPDLRFVVAGVGPQSERRRIRRAIADAGCPDAVRLLGAVTENEKRRLLEGADCLVVPNVERRNDPEGFGLVVLEANAHGLPVLATAVDALPELISDGVNGFVVESPESWGAMLDSVLAENSAWAKRCRAYADAWGDWTEVADGFIDYFRRAIAPSTA